MGKLKDEETRRGRNKVSSAACSDPAAPGPLGIYLHDWVEDALQHPLWFFLLLAFPVILDVIFALPPVAASDDTAVRKFCRQFSKGKQRVLYSISCT